MLLAILTSCSRQVSDPVLDLFRGRVVTLSPSGHIGLEEYGILYPSDLLQYGEHFLVYNSKGTNIVDIVSPENTAAIPWVGRGPNELLFARGFQIAEDSLFLYEVNYRQYFKLNLPETLLKGEEAAEGLVSFVARDGFLPSSICRTGNNFIAAGIYDRWFGLTDSTGSLLSGIDHVDFVELEGFNSRSLRSLFGTSAITVSPDGKHAACGMVTGQALSICEIVDGSELEEIRRIAFAAPDVSAYDSPDTPTLRYNAESRSFFLKLRSDSQFVYALYSGRKLSKEKPFDEGSDILVFDWEGNPVKRFVLPESTVSFDISDGILSCLETAPECRIARYKLEFNMIR